MYQSVVQNLPISLDKVTSGSLCIVESIEGTTTRLCSFGLCPADEILLENKSIFGETLYISILNYPSKTRIALSREQAHNIKVIIINRHHDKRHK